MNYLDFCEFTVTILQGEGNIQIEMRLAVCCHLQSLLQFLTTFNRFNLEAQAVVKLGIFITSNADKKELQLSSGLFDVLYGCCISDAASWQVRALKHSLLIYKSCSQKLEGQQKVRVTTVWQAAHCESN